MSFFLLVRRKSTYVRRQGGNPIGPRRLAPWYRYQPVRTGEKASRVRTTRSTWYQQPSKPRYRQGYRSVLTRDRRSSSEALMTALKTIIHTQGISLPPTHTAKSTARIQNPRTCVGGFRSRLSVRDDDDQERLAQLPSPGRMQQHGLEHFLVERGPERGKSAEPDLGDDLRGLSFRSDVIALRRGEFQGVPSQLRRRPESRCPEADLPGLESSGNGSRSHLDRTTRWRK